MPSAPPRVAAVVCNYNGREITLAALAGLRAMTYPAFDVLVVDNASTDGSHEAVAAAFPDVRQLRVEENRGSAAGYAAGFSWAFALGYDWVLLLNNDIEVDPGMLTEMLATAASDPTIGVVGPKCYYHADRRRIWSAGGRLRFREAITTERGQREIDRGQFDRDEEVDYVNGCAILIHRAAAAAAGAWDAVYVNNTDDADFCIRVRRAGFRCFFSHRARLWHMVALTLGGYVARRTFWGGRAAAIYVRRYARWWQWASYLAASAAAIPLAFLRELPKGNQTAAVAKLKGMVAGLRMTLPSPPRFGGAAGGDGSPAAAGGATASAPGGQAGGAPAP